MLASSGAQLEAWLPDLGLALAAIPIGEELAAAEALDAEPAVDFIAPNRKLARVADVPLDPYWPQQWGMAKVSAPAAWDLAGQIRASQSPSSTRGSCRIMGIWRPHVVQPR